MIVLVAGGTGMLGRRVVERLTKRGDHVVVYHRGTRNVPTQADAIVNCIGIIRESGHQTFRESHVEVTKWLVGLGKKLKVQQFVQVSALGVDAKTTPYQRTKWEAEELVRKSRLPYAIIRPSMLFSSDDKSVNTFRAICRTGFFPVLADGRVQPVSADTVADLIVAALDRRIRDRTAEVGGPEVFTYAELADRIHPGVRAFRMPRWIVRTMTWFGSWLPLTVFPTKDMVKMLRQDSVTKDKTVERLGIRNPRLR